MPRAPDRGAETGRPSDILNTRVELVSEMRWFHKVRQYYVSLSVGILNAALIFVAVNVAIYGMDIVWSKLSPRDTPPNISILDSYGPVVYTLYPDLSDGEVDRLLSETWSRPYIFEPFTQFKERPFRGKYVNVDANGFRVGKDQGPWPIDRANFNVFLFGGSTTFSYGLADDQTAGSFLQDLLNAGAMGRPARVYNFGRGFYYSSQERILFEKLLLAGHVPDLAIFVDGLNEFYHTTDEPKYSAELGAFLAGEKVEVDTWGGSGPMDGLPVFKAVRGAVRNLKRLFGSDSAAGGNGGDRIDVDKSYNDPRLLRGIVDRYLANKKIIEAVADSQGVSAAFVWQPVPTYKYNLDHHAFAKKGFGKHTYSRFGYPMMAQLHADRLTGANFFWCADLQENVNRALYVDRVHYSRELSKSVSECIYRHLRSGGFVAERG